MMAAGGSMNTHQVWHAPPSGLILVNDEVHVWRVHLDVPVAQLADMRDILSKEELERAARFYFDKDRFPWMVARGTLRLLLSKYTGIAPRDPEFRLNEYGKPFL